MNIQQIEYVIAVGELRNFGKAAERCHISQSTLSTMIGKLEDELGIRIFDRSTKPVTVTVEGEALIDQFKIIDNELSSLNELAMSLRGEISGTLKIGVIPTIAPFILPNFLTDFVSQYPKVKFQVRELTTAAIIDGLISRELDIGIASLPLDHDDLLEYPIYDEEFVLVDCQSTNGKKTVAAEHIDFSRLWLLEDGHCMRSQVMKICELDKAYDRSSLNFEYKSGTIDSLMRFVKKNKGVTLLPWLATLDLSPMEKKKISYFKSPVPVRTVGLVTYKHFVKKKLRELLGEDIKKSIVPMLSKRRKTMVVNPDV